MGADLPQEIQPVFLAEPQIENDQAGLARGEMPPGVTTDDLQAMGLPLPKPGAGGPAQGSKVPKAQRIDPAATAFSCDSPDE